MFEKMKIRYLVALLFLLFFAGRVGALLFPDNGDGIVLVSQLLAFLVLPLVFFGYYFRKQQASVKDVVFTKGFKHWILPLVGLGLLFSVLLIGTFWLILFLLFPIVPGFVESAFLTTPIPENPLLGLLTLLLVSFIFPIADEFIFRGAVLKRLVAKISKWKAILLSSLLYSVMFPNFFGALVFSIVASLLYLKTNNLLVPIALNFFFTWFSVSLLFFLPPESPTWLMLTETSDIYSKAVPNALVLIISLLLIIWTTKRLLKVPQPEVEKEEVIAHT